MSPYQDLVEFFNNRHPQLQKYLFWQVRSEAIAEELAQETYLRFLKQPKPVIDLNAFLFTIAANLARDHQRSAKRRQNLIEDVFDSGSDVADTRPTPEDQLAKQAMQIQLQQAIDSLPEKTREIFLLYRAEELSYKQIAARLEITERNVEYHLSRAMLLCRRFLTNSD